MQDVLYVQCPNKNCGKVLTFKPFPNYQEANITCPFCSCHGKIKEFISFTPKTNKTQTPQNNAANSLNQGGTPMQKPIGIQNKQNIGNNTDQTRLLDSSAQKNAQTVKIRCIDNGMEQILKTGKNTIGRTSAQPQATITFPDPEKYISRNHATINVVNTPAGLAIQLSDNSSVNGTFVQGKRLPGGTIVKLQPGTTITLGRMRFIITIDGDADKHNNTDFASTQLI